MPNSTTFINWKRYNIDGQTDLADFSSKDNFIIKGNNSQKKRLVIRKPGQWIQLPYRLKRI